MVINLVILGIWIFSIAVTSLGSYAQGYTDGKEYMAKHIDIGDPIMCNRCGYKAMFEAKE